MRRVLRVAVSREVGPRAVRRRVEQRAARHGRVQLAGRAQRRLAQPRPATRHAHAAHRTPTQHRRRRPEHTRLFSYSIL